MASRYFVAQATQVALLVASLFSASSATAAYPVSAGPTFPSNMRNYQYCEAFMKVPTAPPGQTQPVMNTSGYNTCPNWQALQAQDIIDSYNTTYYPGNPYGLPSGATSLLVDWPRNWIFDQVVMNLPTGTTQYLSLDVGETTFGFVGFNTGSTVGTPYTQSIVQRNTTYTYDANSLIFELLDSSGNLYVMQSYARFVNPTLTYDDLKDSAYMDYLLDLPTGWSYSVKQLSQQFNNVSTGNAVLVQDKLANSYMMVDPTLSTLPVATPYSVPGPLPIFGAGMAFGFSRRLRARIKKAAV
jgi:haloalkane dehalogenase